MCRAASVASSPAEITRSGEDLPWALKMPLTLSQELLRREKGVYTLGGVFCDGPEAVLNTVFSVENSNLQFCTHLFYL